MKGRKGLAMRGIDIIFIAIFFWFHSQFVNCDENSAYDNKLIIRWGKNEAQQ